MSLTLVQSNSVGDKLGLNWDIIDHKMWNYAMRVELEHGKRSKITNVTNNNLLITGKIALAHLIEFPNYYIKLEKMEDNLKKGWKGKKKPSIIVKKGKHM